MLLSFTAPRYSTSCCTKVFSQSPFTFQPPPIFFLFLQNTFKLTNKALILLQASLGQKQSSFFVSSEKHLYPKSSLWTSPRDLVLSI